MATGAVLWRSSAVKLAPGDELDAHHVEEVLADAVRARDERMIGIERGALNAEVEHAVAVGAERHRRGGRDAGDAADRAEPIAQSRASTPSRDPTRRRRSTGAARWRRENALRAAA